MPKGYWKHINGRDMFIEILKSYDVNPKYYKIKYRCWNIGEFSEPFLMTTQIFRSKLMKTDIANWRRYVVD